MKDLTLLRPFDLEAAKRGDPLLYESHRAIFTAGPNAAGECVFDIEDRGFIVVGTNCRVALSTIKMAPLAWVEDRPVYAGDNLCFLDKREGIARGIREGFLIFEPSVGFPEYQLPESFTWNKPQVKLTLTVDEALAIYVEGRKFAYRFPGQNPYLENTVEGLLWNFGCRLQELEKPGQI